MSINSLHTTTLSNDKVIAGVYGLFWVNLLTNHFISPPICTKAKKRQFLFNVPIHPQIYAQYKPEYHKEVYLDAFSAISRRSTTRISVLGRILYLICTSDLPTGPKIVTEIQTEYSWDPRCDRVKYLSLHLDSRLTWKKHIFAKSKHLGRLVRHWLASEKVLLADWPNAQLSFKSKLILYKAVLKPIWAYGIQLWGKAWYCNIKIIQRFQNKILRVITRAPWFLILTISSIMILKSTQSGKRTCIDKLQHANNKPPKQLS